MVGLLLLLCWIWLRCFGLLRLGFRVGRVFLRLLGAVLCILVVLDLVCCLFAGVLCVGLGLVLLRFGCGMLCICLCIIVVDGLRVLGIGFVQFVVLCWIRWVWCFGVRFVYFGSLCLLGDG